ncbi:MAG: hypothetical protein HZC42_00685 [Candidatus Eisenbacteria bacterium]|nr:hypothetical protein [Candidatus Eisenbacteria bacterium]
MILRLVAGLSLLLGTAVLASYLLLVGRGPLASPAGRHLRAMKERRDAPSAVTPYTLAGFQALPHDAPQAAVAALERHAVSLEGYVQRMLHARDGDTHLEIAVTPRAPGGPDTAYVTAEITLPWRRGSRSWSYESLLAAFRPNRGGAAPWEAGPRRVRVTGWLLYDYQYDSKPTRYSLIYGARATGWEIHPVTRIELWSDSLRGFVDHPR